VRLRGLCDRQEVLGVAAQGAHEFAAILKAFARERSDGLEQPIALAVRRRILRDQADGPQVVQGFGDLGLVSEHRAGRLDSEAAGEHAKPGEDALMGGGQPMVAPVEGVAQRALPVRQVAWPGLQRLQSAVLNLPQQLDGVG